MARHLRPRVRMMCLAGVLAAIAGAATGACGGGSKSPSSPSPGTGAGNGATVTITSTGVSPKQVTIAAGQRVTFVNNDSRAHFVASNPHPDHTDCPQTNQIGVIDPQQTKETGNYVTVRTCGYHDHDRPQDTSLQGTIVIH